ncbi:hypothetical protein [Schaalia meyeri]|uniref:hypothetical protein n=1 Tax=Schaalia meyeri TaxID=52773 RepID=UPI001F610F5E|nr:hypothetical protein [Schaalia meyeri]
MAASRRRSIDTSSSSYTSVARSSASSILPDAAQRIATLMDALACTSAGLS